MDKSRQKLHFHSFFCFACTGLILTLNDTAQVETLKLSYFRKRHLSSQKHRCLEEPNSHLLSYTQGIMMTNNKILFLEKVVTCGVISEAAILQDQTTEKDGYREKQNTVCFCISFIHYLRIMRPIKFSFHFCFFAHFASSSQALAQPCSTLMLMLKVVIFGRTSLNYPSPI